MSAPPRGPRPPISSFDEPIDDSGADEAEAKRAARKSNGALPDAAKMALRLKGLGFTVMPLPTNAKSPPPTNWEVAARNNPAVFLSNPGTHNYAILPPPGCFGWDVDKGVPALLIKMAATLGHAAPPQSLTTVTPNGHHVFFRWPEDLPRPRGPMFGEIVTRWPAGDEGQGYLVGPGSVVVQENGSLGTYHLFDPTDDGILDLPRDWAEAAVSWRAPKAMPASGPLAEVTEKYSLPESVSAGMRYESIRGYTAHLYNRGFSSREMWPLVQTELAPRFTEALSHRELRDRFERAVRDLAERLGEPRNLAVNADTLSPYGGEGVASVAPETTGESKGLPSPLFVDSTAFADELRLREPIDYLVPGWIVGAGLTVVAGHPKSMKSLALLQMLGSFVAGGEWLGTTIPDGGVRVGLYLTREGSHSEMLKRVDALIERHGSDLGNRLRFAYEQPIEFSAPSYRLVGAALAAIESEMSVLPGKLRVMLVLDPLRDFMPDGGDENEAKTMAVVKRWCRTLISDFPFVGVVLVHHLRKSASGSTGLEMSGSGAMYGAVDSTVVWRARKDDLPSDDEESGALAFVGEMYGSYRVETRGDAPFTGRWRFDADSESIVTSVGRQVSSSGRAVPGTAKAGVLEALRSLGTHGATTAVVGEMCDISTTNARVQLHRLRDRGSAVQEGGRWFGQGLAPHQGGDVILPVEPVDEGVDNSDDGEGWVDPIHRLS